MVESASDVAEGIELTEVNLKTEQTSIKPITNPFELN